MEKHLINVKSVILTLLPELVERSYEGSEQPIYQCTHCLYNMSDANSLRKLIENVMRAFLILVLSVMRMLNRCVSLKGILSCLIRKPQNLEKVKLRSEKVHNQVFKSTRTLNHRIVTVTKYQKDRSKFLMLNNLKFQMNWI